MKTKVRGITNYNMKIKQRWAGHIVRVQDNIKTTEREPKKEKSARGKPTRRWCDYIINKMQEHFVQDKPKADKVGKSFF